MQRISELSSDIFEISEREMEYCKSRNIPFRSCTSRERLRHILSFRSSPHLYHAQCSITGKRIVTVVPPNSGFKVYDVLHEDELGAEQYARDYDFSLSFFKQFEKLTREVPYYSRVGVFSSNENSDYCQGISWSKNCYLCFRTLKGEDCFYSRYIRTGKDLVDCIWCVESELAYSCSNITRCYDIAFSENCQDCSSSRFLSDCIGCKDCYCCVGLRNAKYCFENTQLTAEQYRAKLTKINLSSLRQCENWLDRLSLLKTKKSRSLFLDHCEDSTGNHLVRCKNAHDSYFSFDCLDIESSVGVEKLSSSFFSVGLGIQSELLYCCEAVGSQAYDVKFSHNCMTSVQNLEYCINVAKGSAHCFGCVGLRRASYCILNKQYKKEDYFELVERIKNQMRKSGEYGKCMPLSLSPFSFNRSEAYDFLPMSENEAIKYGYRWEPEDPLEPGEVSDLPDSLEELDQNILQKKFKCKATGRQYTIQARELDFHKRMNIALSPYAPIERLYVRGYFLRIV